MFLCSCTKTYNNYEVTYWDNTKDTLYQITKAPGQALQPFEGCVFYETKLLDFQSTCYVKSIKLIK